MPANLGNSAVPTGLEKVNFYPIPKKGNVKEGSNYQTTALISHTSRSRCFSGILFFNDPMDVGNLISGSSAFSKSSLNIWNFIVHILLKAGLENFEHYFALV